MEVRRSGRGLALRIDGSFASWWAPGRAASGSVWEALAAPLLLLRTPAPRVLLLGLAGGSAARAARALLPAARIVGVERDAEVLRAARRWFGLDALGLEAVEADARRYLARTRRRFDAVIEDVFVGRGRAVHKPAWLPEPGLGLAARRLRPGGILVSNTLDETAAVGRALARRFPRVLSIGVRGWDNRVLVGARAGSGRGLRRAAARHPWLAPALPCLRFETAFSAGRPGTGARRG